MKTNLSKVMRKISALKKMYDGAKAINSEGEAANAAYLMQKLLREYNLTLEEVDQEVNQEQNPMLHEEMSGYTYKSIGGRWEQRLLHVICKWNFCRCYTYGSSYKNLIIVGRKENVEIVKWLRDMLSERYVAFSKQHYKEYLKNLKPYEKPMGKDKYQRSYLIGCAVGLDAKLTEEHQREKREEVELSTKITALVVRNDSEIVKYVDKQWGKVIKGRSYRENYDEARAKGYEDGKNTELHKPIAGGRSAANDVKLLG
jgi:hypothetical protein